MKTAYANLNLAISITEKDQKELEKKVTMLHSLSLEIESLVLKTSDGRRIKVEVHNWDIDWETLEEVA